MSFLSRKILMGSGATEETDDDFELVTGLYHFDGSNGGTNNTFTDTSGNSHTITRNGTPTQGTFTPFSADDGKWSNFFRLEDAIMTTSSGSSIAYNQSTFTCEAWILMTKASPGATIPGLVLLDGSNNFGSGALSLAFGPLNNYKLALAWYNGGWINCSTTSATVTPGVWTHVAVSVSSNTIKLFIDGTEITSMSGTTTLSDRSQGTQGYVSIGGTHYASSYSYEGYVSNCRIVDGTALYSGDFTPSTQPLSVITNTDILACNSRAFAGMDTSSTAVSMDQRNTPVVHPFSPFAETTAYDATVHGGSAYFDGTGDYLSIANESDLTPDTGDFTIECWVYFSSTTTNQGVFQLDTTPLSGNTYIAPVLFTGGGAYAGRWATMRTYGGNQSHYADTQYNPKVNEWYHTAVVRLQGEVKVYIDGVAVIEITDPTDFSDRDSITVGSFFSSSYDMTGYISGFRYVKGTALYSSAFEPPTAPPTAVTNTELLLNATNGSIIDSSRKFNLVTANNSQLDTSVKKLGTASYESDGSAGNKLVLPKAGSGAQPNLAPIGFTPFTFEGFIYINSHKNYNAIYSAGYGIQFYVNASGKMQCWVGGDSGYIANGLESTATISTSTWTHFALVRDTSADTITWFVNGTAGGQATSTTAEVAPIPSGEAHTIGSYQSGTYPLDGYLDEFRVTHKARYTSNFTAPTKEYFNVGPTAAAVSGRSIEYLVISGGGGGGKQGGALGQSGGGGGGAGGVITGTTTVVSDAVLAVTVGAGGAGITGNVSQQGNDGTDSSITQLPAFSEAGGGGARGVYPTNINGNRGGSGGGACNAGTPGAGISGQGNAGGNGTSSAEYGGGGGGGAGSVGGNADSTRAGAGGSGTSAYSTWASATSTGASGLYAGGGGGAGYQDAGTQGLAGSGGGGQGGSDADVAAAGTANTGGGGGGGGGRAGTYPSAAGGSGIVIIRYSGSTAASGGTIVESGGYTYHTFTSSGTFTN